MIALAMFICVLSIPERVSFILTSAFAIAIFDCCTPANPVTTEFVSASLPALDAASLIILLVTL